MSGTKYDQGKPDFSYISYEFLEEMARVREFGAKKYARSNWKKGFKVTRSCAAALRHIFKFIGGETNDPESGLCHLSHAACCLEHALWDLRYHPENDDRDKPGVTDVISEPVPAPSDDILTGERLVYQGGYVDSAGLIEGGTYPIVKVAPSSIVIVDDLGNDRIVYRMEIPTYFTIWKREDV